MRLLLATFALLVALAAPAAAAPGQLVFFEAPRDLLDDERRPAALAELDALGVRALRVIVTWRDVAPASSSSSRPEGDLSDPDRYDWSRYDGLLAAARERGWEVLLTLSGPVPRWATQARRDFLTRPRAEELRRFATAAGRRYGEQVRLWSVWNEPNIPEFLKPQFDRAGRPLSPRIYRALFRAARAGLDASGNDDDTVLFGETAPRGSRGVRVTPLAFLRGTLCLDDAYERRPGCGQLDADGFAHHPYTVPKVGIFFVPPNRDEVTIGALSRLTTALDRAARAGAVRRGLPVYLTEFGIQSTPDRLFGVSLVQQTELRALGERLAWENPRVRSFSQYLLRDDPPVEDAPPLSRYQGFETGLRFATGRPKPSLEAFRLPLAAVRRDGRVTVWGLVRPARAATTAELLVRDRGQRAFRRLRLVRTDDRGGFTVRALHRRGRRFALRWKGFESGSVVAYARR